MLNIGIIGCGKIGQVRHLPEYAANPDVNIAGVFDINQARADEIAGKYGAKAYGSYQELLADPGIDAVSVCTINSTHAQISIAALEAGKHVLCEKPMATTLSDCETMVRVAKKCERILMIGQNQRLAGAHVMAKELIEGGAVGDVISFRTAFRHGGPETWSVDSGAATWFFDKKRAAMGAMADLGVHKTDLISYLIGQKVAEVTARLYTLDKRFSDGSPITVDDNAICIYRMDGGAAGSMTASWTDYGPEDNSTVIYGTKGVLRIYDDPAHALILHEKGGETRYFEVEGIQTNDKQEKSGVIDLFVDSVLGRSDQCITGESVLSAMRAVFAAIESSETGHSVLVNA